jgi:hypothetical protein
LPKQALISTWRRLIQTSQDRGGGEGKERDGVKNKATDSSFKKEKKRNEVERSIFSLYQLGTFKYI